jgi:hypothetical protein
VDVIAIVDNSGDMEEEVEAIRQHVHRSFAAKLEQSGVDYRFILISEYAEDDGDDTALCIEGMSRDQGQCSGDEPIFSERFFQYSTPVGSDDSLEVLLETFSPPLDRDDDFDNAPNGWSEWLRAGAKKVFLELSDDDSDLSATELILGLTEISADFGTAASPSFVFHSVVGLIEKDGTSEPYAADEPVQEDECEANGGDVNNAGEAYQELSRLTGGLRFPICRFDAYDQVFQRLASEIARASQSPCDVALPGDLATDTIDPNAASLRFTAEGGAPVTLRGVSDASACTASGFLLEDGHASLCPAACDATQPQPGASVAILMGCVAGSN